MQKTYTIYMLTNKITGKAYIGQTSESARRRFQYHQKAARKGSKALIHEALRKYGKDNFDLTVLDSDIPVETVDNCEIYWIRKLKTRMPDGYNMQGGGKSAKGEEHHRYGYSSHGEIVMCDKDNSRMIKVFSGAMDAERYLRDNGHEKANHWPIVKCCLGRQSVAYGYKWRFRE